MITGAAAVLSLLAQAVSQPASETWRESASGLGPVLSLGEPDNAMIRIRCVRRGVLRAYLGGLYTGDGPQPRAVSVSSGRARSVYRLRFGVDPEGEFSADIPIQSAPMISFGRSGRLSFAAAGAELDGDAAKPEEIRVVSAFLRRCGG
jgi:hypothetical protein